LLLCFFICGKFVVTFLGVTTVTEKHISIPKNVCFEFAISTGRFEEHVHVWR
jgi:hypothetical protein